MFSSRFFPRVNAYEALPHDLELESCEGPTPPRKEKSVTAGASESTQPPLHIFV